MYSEEHSVPGLVVHADWSTNPRKRWMALATLSKKGNYSIDQPEKVGNPNTLLYRLRKIAREDALVFLGFDFPIGLPLSYANKVKVADFLQLLPILGQGEWKDFFNVAETCDQINLHRPFYPQRPGGKKHRHLTKALGVENINDLRRNCDLAHTDRRAAAPLFWTLGSQQVGKAAISGWKEVLLPGLLDEQIELYIWPFSGELSALSKPSRIVVAETYPTEIYSHLGIAFSARRPGHRSGKRTQADRQSNAPTLLEWAERANVSLSVSLRAAIISGFGSGPAGEDLFDATIGLFGMLNTVLGFRKLDEPKNKDIRRIEGWILGQDYI